MKHFLNSRYEYANEWVDDVIPSQFSMYFVYKILKIFIFYPIYVKFSLFCWLSIDFLLTEVKPGLDFSFK